MSRGEIYHTKTTQIWISKNKIAGQVWEALISG